MASFLSFCFQFSNVFQFGPLITCFLWTTAPSTIISSPPIESLEDLVLPNWSPSLRLCHYAISQRCFFSKHNWNMLIELIDWPCRPCTFETALLSQLAFSCDLYLLTTHWFPQGRHALLQGIQSCPLICLFRRSGPVILMLPWSFWEDQTYL